MFDIGFWEILLILVLALVVIGPERLPGAARRAGYLIGKARRYIEGVRSEVESEFDVSEFKRLLHNQEVQINELQQQLRSSVEKTGASLNESVSAPGSWADHGSQSLKDNDVEIQELSDQEFSDDNNSAGPVKDKT
jgi:sec-independent protein translocase protein TatB